MEREHVERLKWLKVYEPFPTALNPCTAMVQRQTVAWARHFQLVPDAASAAGLDATQLGALAGRFHPTAAPGALQLVADWYTWMFLRDDQRDESDLGKLPALLAAQDGQLLAVLKGREPPAAAEPLAHALWDLAGRLHATSPSSLWLRRFLRAVKTHFDATVWEATNRAQHVTPDLATYIRMRPLTGGMHVDTAFIALTEGDHLPPEIRSQGYVQRVTEASNNAVCWANDLLSLSKELASGDVHNLVLVLRHENRLAIEDAIAWAIELHTAEVQAFLTLSGQLPVFGSVVDAGLQSYVAVLRARMRGNVDWSLLSERYSRTVLALRPVDHQVVDHV